MSVRRHIEPSGRTILVVDDQVETLTSVRMLLEREGHRVLTADSGAGALTLLASEPVHLMLVDYFMPVMNGEELIRHVRAQDSLVQKFLDLSKLEAGAMVMRREAVDVGMFLRELGESFALLIRSRPVEFRVDVPDELPAVAADGAKLRVVIQNLLSNAEKFTERGEIEISAVALDGRQIAIRVRDTGPGIAPEHHEAIFDIFHQLRPHDGQTKGVGLGLALARRFARMMEGDITVESAVGSGTIFTVVLPTVRAEQESSLSGEVAA